MNPYETTPPPLPDATEADSKSAGDWLQRLLAHNPFYIISAALLLYGIYRLSVDPKIFASEVAQLFFNFGSFQFYELLLVATAVVLARREIWYDSGLLVCLENLFVFIPFILISQALLIENHIALTFCLLASLLAAARFGALKKFFVKINFPPRLLVLGGVLLLVNLALPLVVRDLHRDRNTLTWETTGGLITTIAWLFTLPAVLGLANLLPRPAESSHFLLRKGWFPLVLFTIWTAVTATHLYCVGYVYEMKWSWALLTPLLWVAAWTTRHRLNDFDVVDEETEHDTRNLLLIGPAVITVLAAWNRDWNVFFILTALNALAYGVLFFRDKNFYALHLLMLSGAALIAGVPESILFRLDIRFSRGMAIGVGLGSYTLLRAILSSNPKLGLIGSVVAAIGSGYLFRYETYQFNLPFQVGLVFLILHSLRWKDAMHPGATLTRSVFALAWTIHTLVWLANDGMTAVWATVSLATAVATVYVAVRIIFGFWGSRVIPLAVTVIVLSKPVLLAATSMKNASTGLIAVIGSFALFALGTGVAMTRNYWNKSERPFPVNAQTNKATL